MQVAESPDQRTIDRYYAETGARMRAAGTQKISAAGAPVQETAGQRETYQTIRKRPALSPVAAEAQRYANMLTSKLAELETSLEVQRREAAYYQEQNRQTRAALAALYERVEGGKVKTELERKIADVFERLQFL